MRNVVHRLAAAAALAGMLVAGCTFPPVNHVTELARSRPNPAIVLMPLDVELTEMNVGGVLEPKPDWTQAARQLMGEEIRAQQAGLGFRFVEFAQAFKGSADEEELIDQITKVQAIVGRSIMLHRNPTQELPSLGKNPKYSLGEDVRVLRERTGADYALFVHVRDSYASDGRKLAMVAGLALRMGILGGGQYGFATLVDLRNGDIVWFNELNRLTGDMRTREPAMETVQTLFTGFPK